MGLLDPKITPEHRARGFELLRKKGATRAELSFYGGHDEGSVQSITLTVPAAAEDAPDLMVDLEVWYCGGYMMGDDNSWVPASTWENEDQELSDILQGPIDQTFGSWASVDSTSGSLTWEVEGETIVMDYEQDEPTEYQVTF